MGEKNLMTIKDYSFSSFSYYYRCKGEVDQNFIQILFSRDRFPGLSTLRYLSFDACPTFVSFHLRFSRVTFKGDRVSQEFNDRQNGVSGRRIYNTVGNLSSNSWPRHDKSRALKERRKIRVTEKEREMQAKFATFD